MPAKKKTKATKKPATKAANKKAAPKKAAPKKAAPKKAAGKPAASKGASWKPKDWHVLTVGCAIKRAALALGFYEALFGAKVRSRMDGPGGVLAHADLAIGDANFMIGEPMFGMPEQTMSVMLYTPNADQLFHQALASGCKELEGMKDQFWGDRTGRVLDPFGNSWMIAKKIEDVSPAEMARRMAKLSAQAA